MYATSLPTPQPDNLPLALQQARERVAYLIRRWYTTSTPDIEKANIYGQFSTLSDVLEWIEGILAMQLPKPEEKVHLGTLAAFIRANYNREQLEARTYERTQTNNLKWHSLITGKVQGYTYALAMLSSLGITPLR